MVECKSGGQNRKIRFITVIDANAGDLFSVSMLLQRLEYNVCSTRSGVEALEMMSVARPALVVAALESLETEEGDLLQKMKRDPRTASIPVVILVPAGDRAAMKRCSDAGAAACLSKPVQPEDLYRAVQSASEPAPRANIRIHVRLPVTVNNVPLDCGSGECASVLSEHGMYIRTLKAYPVNMRLPIALIVGGKTISVDAVVLYSHQAGQGPFGEPGMGIKFVRVSPEDQEFIRQFIRDEVTRGIVPE